MAAKDTAQKGDVDLMARLKNTERLIRSEQKAWNIMVNTNARKDERAWRRYFGLLRKHNLPPFSSDTDRPSVVALRNS